MSATLDERSQVSEFGLINPARDVSAHSGEPWCARGAINWAVQLQRRMGDVSRLRRAKALNDRCRPAEELHVGII